MNSISVTFYQTYYIDSIQAVNYYKFYNTHKHITYIKRQQISSNSWIMCSIIVQYFEWPITNSAQTFDWLNKFPILQVIIAGQSIAKIVIKWSCEAHFSKTITVAIGLWLANFTKDYLEIVDRQSFDWQEILVCSYLDLK